MGELRVLGPLELIDGKRRVPLGAGKERALLAWLFLEQGQVVSSDRLIDLLWDASPPASAGVSLRVLISRLRKALGAVGADGALLTEPPGYRLDLEGLQVDSVRFEALVGRGRADLEGGDAGRAAASLRDALALWRGPALADLADALGASGPIARLEEARLVALELRMDAELASGAHHAVLAELEALCRAHPLREGLWKARITALYRSGRQADALRAYQELRTHLLDEVGIDPSPELQALERAVLQQDGSLLLAPTGAAPVGRGASFVGRASELDATAAALREHRLVTLVGLGGMGKTRLAREVGSSSATARVVTAELARLRAPDQVASAVAAAVGADSVETTTAAIGDEELLLVLDSCEHHLAAAAGLVSGLLGACGGLRVLCTSQAALGIEGEHLAVLSGLDADAAVMLFLDRLDPRIGEVDRRQVEEVCDRLDGHPLAIELAAARLRSMSLDDLAQRLHDPLSVLTTGPEEVPRHQTLRAALDWSWALLAEPERAVLRRASVFAAPFTLEAIETVGAGPDVRNVAEAVDDLVARSLAQFEPSTGRYRLLDSIRQYAGERLDEAGEAEPTRVELVRWASDLAAALAHHYHGEGPTGDGSPGRARLAGTLHLDADNLGAAIALSMDADDLPSAADLVSTLHEAWFSVRKGDGRLWVPPVMARRAELDEALRARVLLAAGMTFSADLSNDRVPDWLQEAEATFRRLGDDDRLASALLQRGRALANRAQAKAAVPCLEEAASLFERLGEEYLLGWSTIWWAIALKRAHPGDFTRPRELLERTLTRARSVGCESVVGSSLSELGAIEMQAGRLDVALQHSDSAIVRLRQAGHRWQLAMNLHARARLELWMGHPRAAADMVESLELLRAVGAAYELVSALYTSAELLEAGGQRDEATVLLAACLRRGRPDHRRGALRIRRDGPFDRLDALLQADHAGPLVAEGRSLDDGAVIARAASSLSLIAVVSSPNG